jgi:hypothetical protein
MAPSITEEASAAATAEHIQEKLDSLPNSHPKKQVETAAEVETSLLAQAGKTSTDVVEVQVSLAIVEADNIPPAVQAVEAPPAVEEARDFTSRCSRS